MSDFKSKIEQIVKKLSDDKNLAQEKYHELFFSELQDEINFLKSMNEEKDIDKYLASLNEEMRNLSTYGIKTKDDFIQRLIMFLNAKSDTQPLGIVEVNLLSNVLIKLLGEICSDNFKKENPQLFNFSYPKTSAEIKDLFEGWDTLVRDGEHIKILKQLVFIIIKFIHPCIDDLKPQIRAMVATLDKTPQSITDSSILKELEAIVDFRNRDWEPQEYKILKKNDKGIKQNTAEILFELDNIINSNNKSFEEIAGIQKDIVGERRDVEEQKQNLIKILDALREKILESNNILKSKEEKIKLLYKELNNLTAYVKDIEERSRLDHLTTEVYNRKYIDKIADICEKEFKKNNINYAVLFFDIDNFKHINDTYGHAAGDKLLGVFSRILKENCRGTDMVGRYGGDEFIILMSNTNLEKAIGFAKRICKTIEESNFTYKGKKIKITTSIGIAVRSSYNSKYDMIDSADKLLYKAKSEGKNRFEWS